MARVTKTFSDLWSFGRSSVKEVYGSNGLLTSIAAGSPAYDFDPAALAARGILLEAAASNLWWPASSIANDVATACVLSDAAGTAPDGTNSASSIVETAVTSGHVASRTAATGLQITAAQQITYSIYVKQGPGPSVRYLKATLLNASVSGDLINMTVSGIDTGSPALHTGVTGTGVITASGIQSVGGGWYRAWMTGKVSTATGFINRQRALSSNITGGGTNYAGDGTSGLLLWGEMVEAGLGPSSFIATSSAAVTRSADALYESPLQDWFNPSQGTILVHGIARAAAGAATQIILRFDDGSNSNKIVLSNPTGTSNIQLDIIAGGVSLCSEVAGTLTPGNLFLLGASVTNGVFSASLNGGTAVSGGSAGIPAGLSRLIVGADDLSGTNAINGWIKRLGVAGVAYTAAELPNLTASESVFGTL